MTMPREIYAGEPFELLGGTVCDTSIIVGLYSTEKRELPKYYSQAVLDEKDARIKELEQLNEGVPFSQQQMMSWKKPLMKKMHDEGMSSRAISRVLDVSHETVSSFVKALAGKGGE